MGGGRGDVGKLENWKDAPPPLEKLGVPEERASTFQPLDLDS